MQKDSRNIQSDEEEDHSLGPDSCQLLVGDIVKQYIIKSVDPKRREDEEDKGGLRD